MSAARERLEGLMQGLDARMLETRDGIPCAQLAREQLRPALERLHADGFLQSTFVTVVDHFPAEPRFELLHQLLSHRHNQRVRLAVRVPSTDAWVPTCTDLFPGAAYSEREVWDMFGVRFEGLADHRRLLMPDAYDHHPLRKDFPHRGIEPDRLYRLWDEQRRQGVPESAR